MSSVKKFRILKFKSKKPPRRSSRFTSTSGPTTCIAPSGHRWKNGPTASAVCTIPCCRKWIGNSANSSTLSGMIPCCAKTRLCSSAPTTVRSRAPAQPGRSGALRRNFMKAACAPRSSPGAPGS